MPKCLSSFEGPPLPSPPLRHVGIKRANLGHGKEKLLSPKTVRIHIFEMTNLIDYIIENIIHLGPNFISLESMKKIANDSKKEEQKKGPHTSLFKIVKKIIRLNFDLLVLTRLINS